jgi:hypothetical protein
MRSLPVDHRLLEEGTPKGRVDPQARARDPWEGAGGPRLLCVRCGQVVTAGGWATDVGEAHEHSFVNPHGYLFRIGCFLRAPGCLARGEPRHEYSWFSDHHWSVADCSGCGGHLGWSFAGPQRFFGLILDRLVQERQGESGSA